MTIKELIQNLQRYPEDIDVYVSVPYRLMKPLGEVTEYCFSHGKESNKKRRHYVLLQAEGVLMGAKENNNKEKRRKGGVK